MSRLRLPDSVGVSLAYAGLAVTATMFAATVALTWRGADVTLTGSALGDATLPVGFLASAAVGALVLTRHPRLLTGWLFVVAAILGASQFLALRQAMNVELVAHEGPQLLLVWLQHWIWIPSLVPLTTLLPLTFPDGRLPSARWRWPAWAAGVAVVGMAVVFAFRPGPLTEPFTHHANPFGADGPAGGSLRALEVPVILLWVASTGAGVTALVIRFRRGGPVERQQLKWFAYAAAVVGLMFAAYSLGFYTVGERATLQLLGPLLGLSLSALPAATGVAILRYRLYDIDLVIRRTVVYALLSALLLATYAAAVVVFQSLLRPFTAGSDIAVAASTLFVVTLVLPLRRRIQDVVDLRFYRSRYDAARTLDAFGARLRDEVDIESVRTDLLGVVHETVRPSHAGVWLREARD